jgi:hypothetical protein
VELGGVRSHNGLFRSRCNSCTEQLISCDQSNRSGTHDDTAGVSADAGYAPTLSGQAPCVFCLHVVYMKNPTALCTSCEWLLRHRSLFPMNTVESPPPAVSQESCTRVCLCCALPLPVLYSLTSARVGARDRPSLHDPSAPLCLAVHSCISTAFAQWLSVCASWMAFSVLPPTLSLHVDSMLLHQCDMIVDAS